MQRNYSTADSGAPKARGLAAYNDKDSGNAAGVQSPPGARTAKAPGTGSAALPDIDRRAWDTVRSKVEELQY